MCANVTPSSVASASSLASASTPTSTSTSTSTGRSFFSRLASPLKTRTRNLHDFHIKPDDPYKRYSPGDVVKGAVVLEVLKPIRITHLTVCLHGFVKVFKSPNAGKQPMPDVGLIASNNPKKSQYFGNGHCSLFQDEQVLCGEGRLDIGRYEFNFELDFPEKGVPTSIDFERGTISYLITATVTRPTSISTTSSCDTKLTFVETVDIAPLTMPESHLISLQPMSRRPKIPKTTKNKENDLHETKDNGSRTLTEVTRATTSPRPDESASQFDTTDYHTSLRSPVPSEARSTVSAATSTDSTVSDSTGRISLQGVPSSSISPRHSQKGSSKLSKIEYSITAKIELLKTGFLPGDNIPVKISIKHIKAIKSMHGIIITLYRQGRVDSAPPLSLFGDVKGKDAQKAKHEEYYPKSKTGLTGISLSSAGSSSVFRKDLSQTFAPILVDPSTLTCVVNASLRVPEDVFPTIKGVPGDMINFKYCVEVVLDLGGKLAGQQRHIPRVGAVTVASQASGSRVDTSTNMLAAWGGSIVDTENIRREKSVAHKSFPVTIGTKDTARIRARRNSSVRRQGSGWPQEVPPTAIHEPIYGEPARVSRDENDYHQQEQPYPYDDHGYNEGYPDYYEGGYDYHSEYREQHPHEYLSTPAHVYIPPPEIEDETHLPEKERARRAEARLLPSQPPTDDAEPSSSSAILLAAPSRPAGETEDLYSADDEVTPNAITTNHNLALHHLSSVPSVDSFLHDRSEGPSAPMLEDLHPSAAAQPTDDKHELERRRLMAEASAPLFPDEEAGDNAGEEGSGGGAFFPTAPVLEEDFEHFGGYAFMQPIELGAPVGAGFGGAASGSGSARAGEELPRYER